MKNLMIAITVALSATFAQANQQEVNIKKVNKVAKQVVGSIQTDVIQKVDVKLDEKSNFKSVKTFKSGVAFAGTAKEAAWTKSQSTIDIKAGIQTLTSDAAYSKVQMGLTLGSRTDAIALYSYFAQEWLKSEQQHPAEDDNDQAFRDLLAEAAQTTKLSQVPAQLEKLVVIVKNIISEEPDNTFAGLDVLFNSLKVVNKSNEVILKTTTEVAVDFFGINILIYDLSLNVKETGLNVGGKIAVTEQTERLEEVLTSLKGFLIAIQDASAEQIAELQATAREYADVASEMIKGE